MAWQRRRRRGVACGKRGFLSFNIVSCGPRDGSAVAEPRPLLVFFCLQQSTITVPPSTTATVLTGVSMIVIESMPL